MNIVLVGDSVFDNGPYVNEGDEVSQLLGNILGEDTVTLLAVDGDMTTDVYKRLEAFPEDASHVFVSCGGNDALESGYVLKESARSVGEALGKLYSITERFRLNYSHMLKALLEKHSKLVACTIYNNIPEVPKEALTALALFNEVILEEAFKRKLPVIDLRIICIEKEDYSAVSPIEPSHGGGIKIVNAIKQVLETHKFNEQISCVYT
jgi:lysophospholipase L1-like esterase